MGRGLKYGGWNDREDMLQGYVDSDYAGCLATRKSQTGMIFTVFRTTLSWKSGFQQVVLPSTTKAEYLTITEPVKVGM